MKNCQWCSNSFSAKVSYQVYCCSECREAATKEKIAERYVQSRSLRRVGKDRRCKFCKKPLSVYNDEVLCQKCLIIPSDVLKSLKDLKGFADGKHSKDK